MPSQQEVSDLEITNLQAEFASRVSQGDPSVLNELLSQHQAAVYRYALSLCSSQSDAEDVLQQTFLSAFTSGGTYRGDAPLRHWLLRIARNEAFRLMRKVAKQEEYKQEELGLIGQEAGWGQGNPETLVALASEGARLQLALESLPSELREIIVLRDLEECSGQESADILGISLASMKSRLHRARLKLAQALRKEGET